MFDSPLEFKVIPSISWAYLSCLLTIALYFKFNRFLSIRNLDIILVILLAPGLMMVGHGSAKRTDLSKEYGRATLEKGSTESEIQTKPDLIVARKAFWSAVAWERGGYIFLFLIAAIFAARMLLDPMMARRPLLEPNLSFGGMTFLAICLLGFVIWIIVTGDPSERDIQHAKSAQDLLELKATETGTESEAIKRGPGYPLLFLIPSVPTYMYNSDNGQANTTSNQGLIVTAKIMAILCQLAVVLGIFYIGYFHFYSALNGIGIAALYLMLPYTFEMSGRVEHFLPAALLIWAVCAYRRPMLSGILMGLATGVHYYPVFLMPLWVSFYWKRGRGRFLIGAVSMVALLALSLIFVSTDTEHFISQLKEMFGFWLPRMEGLQGIWDLGWDAVYRLPILAGSAVLSLAFILWPAQKNLGTLISCSSALMIVVQLWHGYGGGLLFAWFLPLALLAIFRPNLEDRVALLTLVDRRKKEKARSAA